MELEVKVDMFVNYSKKLTNQINDLCKELTQNCKRCSILETENDDLRDRLITQKNEDVFAFWRPRMMI